MTYSMLMSIVKYPFSSRHASEKGKFGFFTTEKDIFCKVADELQILQLGDERYARHPLVYVVEAADDICYQVMDIEDAHKLKIVGSDEVIELFLSFFGAERRCHLQQVMASVDDPNEKIGYLRSCIVGALVSECAQAFVDNEQAILSGTFSGCLIDHMGDVARNAYQGCSKLAFARIYRASDVVDIDLAGNQIITTLLHKLVQAVLNPELNYSQLLLSKVPQQYEVDAPTLFEKLQAVIDHISGMTDVYALDLYRKLNGMSLPNV